MTMRMQHAVHGDSLADILERVLDKGVVVAGDVSVALVGIELLTIKLRLVVCSVDKARELGIDWWQHDPYLSSGAVQTRSAASLQPGARAHETQLAPPEQSPTDLAALEDRLARLEARIGQAIGMQSEPNAPDMGVPE